MLNFEMSLRDCFCINLYELIKIFLPIIAITESIQNLYYVCIIDIFTR